MNIYRSALAYYFALIGETDKIPDEFREHKLDGINYLAPCKPMMYLIENRVYLAQGEFAKVIGRSDSLDCTMPCRSVWSLRDTYTYTDCRRLRNARLPKRGRGISGKGS